MVLNTRIIIIEEKRGRRRQVGWKGRGGWGVGWDEGGRKTERRENIYISYFWYGFNLVTLGYFNTFSCWEWAALHDLSFVGSSVTLETGGRDERGFFGGWGWSGSEPLHPPWLSLRHLSLALNHTVTFYLHVWPLDTAFLHAQEKASSSWTLPYSLMIVSSFFLSLVNQRGKIPWIQISKLMQNKTKQKRDYLAFGSCETLVGPRKSGQTIRLQDLETYSEVNVGCCPGGGAVALCMRSALSGPLGVKNDSVGAGSEDWLILSPPSLLSLCWSKSTAPRWQWTKPRRDRENRDRKRGQRI